MAVAPGKLLVILGLRGTLYERIHLSKVPVSMPGEDLVVGMHKIWYRPKMHETLVELREKGCDLAVWTSALRRNSIPVVQTMFPDHEKLFRFVWSRENCTADLLRRAVPVDKDDEHATMKDLRRVWRDFPEYTPARTILVDDDPHKVRGNADNLLWLSTCIGEKHCDEGMTILRNVVVDKLLPAPDVRDILPLKV